MSLAPFPYIDQILFGPAAPPPGVPRAAKKSYQQWEQAMAPGWLQTPAARTWLGANGYIKDWLIARLKFGIMQRFPRFAMPDALAQIGQFGIAFVVVPVWLAQQGLDATQLGLFASALWLGQLPGLGLAPALIARFGARAVTLAGLLCTPCALGWMPCGDWPGWLPAGALAGFGISLRWIGVEPWLYHLAPGEARRVRIVPQPKAMRQWHDGWRKLGDVPLRLARNAEDPGLIVGGKA